MAKPIVEDDLVNDEELAALKELTNEQAGEFIIERLDQYAQALADIGVHPEAIMAAFLQSYCNAACDYGSRELYEEQLEIALEDEWPEIWLH